MKIGSHDTKDFSPLTKLLLVIGAVLFVSLPYVTHQVRGLTQIGTTISTNPDLENGLKLHYTFDGKDIDNSSSTAHVLDRSGDNNHGEFVGGSFPQTSAPTETSLNPTASTTLTVDLPTNVSNGDLLLVFWSFDYTPTQGTDVSAPAGWTELWDTASPVSTRSRRAGGYAKVVDGTEGATVDLTTDESVIAAAAQTYVVTDWYGSIDGVEVGTPVNLSASANPDPPSLTASWGAENNLWFAVSGIIDDDATVSAYPTNYTNGVDTISGGGADDGATVGTARREYAAATDDPGTFTLSESEGATSNTVVVRPSKRIQTTSGRIGQGGVFDGSDDNVTVTSSALDDLNPLTISAWIRPETLGEGNFGRIVSKENSGIANSVQFYVAGGGADCTGGATTNYLGFIKNNSSSGAYVWKCTGNNTITLGEWQHVAVTWGGTSGYSDAVAAVYINGELSPQVGTRSTGGSLGSDAAYDFMVGDRMNGSRAFDGLIDDVRVYDRELSAEEIQRIYELGATTKIGVTQNNNPDLVDGLVGHWTMDGPDVVIDDLSSEIKDSSDYGNHGNWQASFSATGTIPGKVGSAIRPYSGALTDKIIVNSDTELDDPPMSGAAWINLEDPLCSATEICDIMSKSNGTPNAGWIFGIDNTGTEILALEFWNGGSSNLNVHSVDNVISVGNWHHVAFTWNGGTATSDVKLYVDGVSVSFGATTVGSSLNLDAAYSLVIGGGHGTTGNVTFNGKLDDVRLYDKVLTAEEVQRLYELGATTHIGVTQNNNPDLENGLLAHWTFDGHDIDRASTTGEVIERTGNILQGDYENASLVTKPGRIGQAIEFRNGSDTFLDVPYDASLSVTNIGSISFWVKQYSNDTVGNRIMCVDDDDGATLFAWWCLMIEDTIGTYPNSIQMVLSNAAGTIQNSDHTPSNSIQPNEWYHVAINVSSYDTDAIYLNGVSQTLTAGVGVPGPGSFQGISIGNRDTLNRDFDGLVDDLRVYDRNLSAEEVQRLYQLGQ